MASWDETRSVVAFHCNWEPYSSLMGLGFEGNFIPPWLRLVKVMCAGRLDPGAVLLAFEMGAQGVMIMSCREEGCRYGPGPSQAAKTVEKVQGLMRLLGIEPACVVHLPIGPGQQKVLSAEIRSFCHRVSGIDVPSFRGIGREDAEDQDMELPLESFSVRLCLECGKCTGACPLAQMGKEFSPRLMVRHLLEQGPGAPAVRAMAWGCLTCGLCQERCPSGVRFLDFILALRRYYRKRGNRGRMTHGGALHSLMRMHSAEALRQDRLGWLQSGLKVSHRGDLLYFVGCIPYLDLFFDLGGQLSQIPVSVVRLMNELGVEPVVLPNERCCGHDLLWSGDALGFERLRRLNLESFREAGIKTVVTACAECSYMLKHHYWPQGDPLPFEVMHLSEFLSRSGLRPREALGLKATYQDPCRLGRFQGVFEAPRQLLASALQLVEMPHFARGAWCCGNSAWINCDSYSKQMQVERLLEAKGNGSSLIITACPKCQIHLRCATRDPNLIHRLDEVEVQDLSVTLASTTVAPEVCRVARKGGRNKP